MESLWINICFLPSSFSGHGLLHVVQRLQLCEPFPLSAGGLPSAPLSPTPLPTPGFIQKKDRLGITGGYTLPHTPSGVKLPRPSSAAALLPGTQGCEWGRRRPGRSLPLPQTFSVSQGRDAGVAGPVPWRGVQGPAGLSVAKQARELPDVGILSIACPSSAQLGPA